MNHFINDFSIDEEIKNLLDKRRLTSKKEDFVAWEDVKKQIRFKAK